MHGIIFETLVFYDGDVAGPLPFRIKITVNEMLFWNDGMIMSISKNVLTVPQTSIYSAHQRGYQTSCCDDCVHL